MFCDIAAPFTSSRSCDKEVCLLKQVAVHSLYDNFRNHVKTKEERKNKLVKVKEERQKTNGIIKAKDLQRWNDMKIAKMKRSNIPERGDVINDVWDINGKIHNFCL